MESLVANARKYSIAIHRSTNHFYDGEIVPYGLHLEMVYVYAKKYLYLLPEELHLPVLCACWAHDLIEDTRTTYNQIKVVMGEQVAEMVYALTNEKGRNREERGNTKYYAGINAVPGAAFVKICDRLANAKYSKHNKSHQIKMYQKEYDKFFVHLYAPEYADMFKELREIVS